jgi:hypothetical protein
MSALVLRQRPLSEEKTILIQNKNTYSKKNLTRKKFHETSRSKSTALARQMFKSSNIKQSIQYV